MDKRCKELREKFLAHLKNNVKSELGFVFAVFALRGCHKIAIQPAGDMEMAMYPDKYPEYWEECQRIDDAIESIS